jgi:ribonuclease PH
MPKARAWSASATPACWSPPAVEEKVPPFLRGKGQGWVTAEYGMLPRATHTRGNREAAKGKQSGRTQEIQRLIGRSLRAVTDLQLLGERQIVSIATSSRPTAAPAPPPSPAPGSRCASRSTSCMGKLTADPIRTQVAAVSCGFHNGTAVLDLDYAEDRTPAATAISCSPPTARSSRRS